jgi:hypothetical protein
MDLTGSEYSSDTRFGEDCGENSGSVKVSDLVTCRVSTNFLGMSYAVKLAVVLYLIRRYGR